MNPTAQSSRILLLTSPRSPSPAGSAVIQRYRLARARLDGRATPVQRSAGELAVSKRSASLFMP